MITILDGGMGRELSERGAHDNSGLWSARALLEAPELVAEIHRDFVSAGARLITTNSYATVPSYLAKSNLEHRYRELTRLAGEIARGVADEAEALVHVAGSMPPMSESYRPDLVPNAEDSIPVYAALAAELDPFVDVLLCETMSSIGEAEAAVAGARVSTQKPVYVAWTLGERPGSGLRSGESVRKAVERLTHSGVAAILFNCTHADAIAAAIQEAAEVTSLPLGGYANRFTVPEGWTLDNDISTVWTELSPEEFADWGVRCSELGASIVGGCCGIGPTHIEALSQRLNPEAEAA